MIVFIAYLFKFLQLFDQHFQRRALIDVMHVNITDDAFFIDDKERPFRNTVGTQYAKLFRHCPVRPEIGKNVKPQMTHLIGPGKKRGNVINRYSQQNRVITFE